MGGEGGVAVLEGGGMVLCGCIGNLWLWDLVDSFLDQKLSLPLATSYDFITF